MTWQTPTPPTANRISETRQSAAELLVTAGLVAVYLMLAATAMGLISGSLIRAPDPGPPHISDSGEASIPRGEDGQ